MANIKKPESAFEDVLNALNDGKSVSCVSEFFGFSKASVSNMAQFQKAVTAKDHVDVADWVYGSKAKRLGMDAKKVIMTRHGYSIPEQFLPQPEKKPEPKQENPAPTPAPAPQKDYTPYLQSLLTQIGTLNATVTVLRDMGQILHNLTEGLANYMPSVSADLDAIKEHMETSNANLNTVIQQVNSLNDRTKTMMSCMKKG